MIWNVILQGDARERLREIPSNSIQCCITSPPYFGLRSYNTEPQIWGGIPVQGGCKHKWEKENSSARLVQFTGGGPNAICGNTKNIKTEDPPSGQYCGRCGAWRGSLGLESSPAQYVSNLVEIFREVKRILRKDGTFWLNLGDSYFGDSPVRDCSGDQFNLEKQTVRKRSTGGNRRSATSVGGLKSKDLCEIPSEVVRALRADGWWLRSRIPWLKRNSMPEPVDDRPTLSVEYWFLLTKTSDCYYDNEAVRTSSRSRRNSDWFFDSWQGLYEENGEPLALVVNPVGFREAHFAVFPPRSIIPFIKAGTSVRGSCAKCGSPWVRVVEKTRGKVTEAMKSAGCDKDGGYQGRDLKNYKPSRAQIPSGIKKRTLEAMQLETRTLGWRPSCKCYGLTIIRDVPIMPTKPGDPEKLEKWKAEVKEWEQEVKDWRQEWETVKPLYDVCDTIPCIVLDPFVGSGTVPVVAKDLGRDFIGIDLSEDYVQMAQKRVGKKPAYKRLFVR